MPNDSLGNANSCQYVERVSPWKQRYREIAFWKQLPVANEECPRPHFVSIDSQTFVPCWSVSNTGE